MRRLPGVVLVAMLAWLVTSCSSGGGGAGTAEPPASSTATQSTATASPVDPDRAAVVEAYQAWVQASAEALNAGDPDHADLAEHSEGPALVRVRALVEQHASAGRVYRGSPVIESAQVTMLALDAPAEEPNATVLACVDVTNYVLVYEEDGSAVPVQRGLDRYQATADLWYTQGTWRVIDFDELRETAC